MKIFIDFDDVLFNTRFFRKDYIKLFIKYGIPEHIYAKYYYDNPEKEKTRGIMKYDPKKHLKQIGKELNINTEELKKDIRLFVQDTEKYVFRDARKFLASFKKENIFLVSFAKTNFQKVKILNSGLARYFKSIIILDELKAKAVAMLIKRYKINSQEKKYFLDDRLEQINNVKKKYPKAITFLVRRKLGRYHDQKNKNCDFVVENLNAAKKIIKKLCVVS